MPFSGHSYLTSGDIRLMRQVLSRICSQRRIPLSGPQASRLASRLLHSYQDGARDEAALVEALGGEAPSPSPVSAAATLIHRQRHH